MVWCVCIIILFSFFAAEVNTINENTEILHLSPSIMTEYVGENTEKKAEFCDRSCEELGSMFAELHGLRVVINSLSDKLKSVVGNFSHSCSKWFPALGS